MVILVTGGSGSGKSVCDAESEKRVSRHKSLRSGKGFRTIEKLVDVAGAASEFDCCNEDIKVTVLLECVSNLVANELFNEEDNFSCRDVDAVFEKVTGDINLLIDNSDNTVIVTNNIFDDGNIYDEMSEKYMEVLGAVNSKLAGMADSVYEVVAGILLKIK